jgi:hypothetical protein
MFQEIKTGFVIGETYHVKIKKGMIVGDLLFDRYSKSKTGIWFEDLTTPHGYLFRSNDIIIYRYISENEYWAKVKEKYDATCLDIILKRLLNENFIW